MTSTIESLNPTQLLLVRSANWVHPIPLRKYANHVKFDEMPSYSKFSTQLSAGKMLVDSDWETLVFQWLGKAGRFAQEACMATAFPKKANGKYKDW
jgi:hypothetical protein